MSVNKYIGKDGKIKWYFSVRYKNWKGEPARKKKEGFKTQREAKEAEAVFLNSIRNDTGITFENLVEKFIEHREARIEKTTIATKTNVIKTKILPYFAKMPISSIEPSTVMEWQTELINRRNEKTGEPYSETYLRQIHNQLSTIFNFAIRYYGLTRNPAQLCGSMGKQNAEKFDFWTYDEFCKFIEHTKEDIPAYTIFNLFFYSGMRIGELLALTLNDFDFENNTVTINKSVAVIDGKQNIKETKTENSNRTIALPLQIMAMIKEYVNRQYEYSPEERIFPTNKSTLHRIMKKYCELSGVRKIKIHELRHSHASHLIELGISPLSISERLGHKDIKTTLQTYSHLYPNKQSEIAEILTEYII